ncbi:aromatic ring-opening dioxygenase LigA [Cellulomonas sp. DKR-3]|uniref:Aromatic ring-opening dioxygenase LigA n=1 Tax=Cellulomonas fulva TaxID=2835530 RepID=A0ABS5U0J1_9CELL|nr:aromatic ring-opening dioxygenase LigA [Cellulomonas fulva]MBT0994914.1 aromatic ring-opening dioxygenase LigA [Cellulomonas fulva]
MSTTTTAHKAGLVRLLGLITIIFGAVFLVAGATTWIAVSTNLKGESITVSDDATFAGGTVDTPWEAFSEAQIIEHHTLDATGGKTYAQLDREDPLRETAMNGSFLRASLFTSVVAFGVAALVMGLGVVFGIIGYALRKLDPATAVATVEAKQTPVLA